MTDVWPDIVIECSHGARGVRGDFVQLYRWTADQEQWVPTRRRGVMITSLRGNSLDDWLDATSAVDAAPAAAAPLRQKHDIRCVDKGCRERVPADAKSLQYIFTLLSVNEAFHVLAVSLKRDQAGRIRRITVPLGAIPALLAYKNQQQPRGARAQRS